MLIPFLVEPLYDVEKSSRVHVDSSSGSTAAAVGVGGSDDTGNSSSTGSLVKKSSKKFKFRLHAKDSKGATIILMFRALSLADYDAWIMAIKANTE